MVRESSGPPYESSGAPPGPPASPPMAPAGTSEDQGPLRNTFSSQPDTDKIGKRNEGGADAAVCPWLQWTSRDSHETYGVTTGASPGPHYRELILNFSFPPGSKKIRHPRSGPLSLAVSVGSGQSLDRSGQSALARHDTKVVNGGCHIFPPRLCLCLNTILITQPSLSFEVSKHDTLAHSCFSSACIPAAPPASQDLRQRQKQAEGCRPAPKHTESTTKSLNSERA